MDTKLLKEYLKTVLELEKTKFETQQLIRNLKNQKYHASTSELEKKTSAESASGCLPAVGGVIVFFLWAMIRIPSLLAVLFFVGAGVGIGWWIASSKKQAENDENNEEIAKRNRVIEENNSLLLKEAERKNGLIHSSIRQLELTFDKTDTLLKRVYAQNVIYPKYQNLIAVSSLYEYLDSGRCIRLDGPDGAYNLYELEVRLDKIITRMDIIIQNLNQIITNQYYLYSAIKELQTRTELTLNEILKNTEKLDEIATNSAVSAYTSQVIAKNQHEVQRIRIVD